MIVYLLLKYEALALNHFFCLEIVYKEQLKVLEKVSGMVQTATEEKLKSKKQNSFYDKLTELNNKYHPNSHGEKWTREELYER